MNSLQLQPDGQLQNDTIESWPNNSADSTVDAEVDASTDTMSDIAAIKFVDACFAYGENNQILALKDILLEVKQGEFIAIVGGNGSGKSTLSKLINALLVPSNGSVLTLGLDTCSTSEDTIFEIRSQAGLVLQNPDSQMVASIVADDIAFGPENLCVAHNEIITRVDEALDAVKMDDHRNANPAHLSGGQKQRICIAGLLAMRPQILVLDEPAAMLDVRGRRGVRRVLRNLHAAGLTVILVTHFMEEAAGAERIVVLNSGEIVLQGKPREVFKQGELLRAMGLDVPFTVQLSDELNRFGLDVPVVASPEQLLDAVAFAAGIIEQRLDSADAGRVLLSDSSYTPTDTNTPADTKLPNFGRARAGNAHEQSSGPLSSLVSAAPRLPESEALQESASSPVIQLNGVSFSYSSNGQETKALDDVSLTVYPGEFLGIIGHTGSGKSTLLQLMAGLIKTSTGQAIACGVDLSSKKLTRRLHSKVGVVFQYPERQLFATTVATDIAFGPQNAGLNTEQCDNMVRRAMQMLELNYDRYAERSPFELSGGEKRRVAIAGIVAMDPDILIFDEPTAGLDPHGRNCLLNVIKQLNRAGKTIILASHAMDAVANLCNRVLALDHGQVALEGTPEVVFNAQNADELRRINLGLPQATQFALDLAQRGLDLPEGLFNEQDLAAAIAKLTARLTGGDHGGD
jgi:energy-coupling factor transport system ATP-binding protein